jgi:hypothetical protein
VSLTVIAAPTDRHALIRFIAWSAARLGRGVSRIRLIKFLYLADVHLFQQRRQLATGYRWRFHHYGPYTAEAQQDIDESASLGLITCETLPRLDEAGEVYLYRAHGPEPLIYDRFSVSLEAALKREVERWLAAPLNEFLNYVYFDTPPMRDARRGDYLRFDDSTFGPVEPPAPVRPKRYASREAQKAFRRFLESRRAGTTTVPVPRDAVVDDAYRAALEALDAQDALAGPIEGSVDIDPDAMT